MDNMIDNKTNFQLIATKNKTKTWSIIIFFSSIIIFIGYVISSYAGNPIFLNGSILFSLISIWVSYFKSDKLALKSSGSKPIDKNSIEGQRLKKIVSKLAKLMKIPEPKLYIMKEEAINAFATGRSPKHASVSVTTGALEKLNDNELEGVLAHELTHIKNHDILVMSVVASLAGILIGFLHIFQYQSQFNQSKRGNPIQGVLVLVGILIAPIVANLIKASVSRKREYMADMGSAISTQKPEYLASALEKIKLYSRPMIRKNLNTSHLFIASPYRADIAGVNLSFLDNLFADHPPLDERIRILRQGIKK